ncbi:hypothetical protein [Streptosporangium roseum]|uniref:hypothetical protein n=1 Tax=Streptosporangium roseum TaxID=2001 RepID=UPI003332BD84
MSSGAEKRRKAGARRQKDGPPPEARKPRAAGHPLTAPGEVRRAVAASGEPRQVVAVSGEARPEEARRFEALGRVMAALAGEAELMESCRDLTWWRGADQSWHVEWRDGPHAAEVAAALTEHVRDPGLPGALAVPAGPATSATAALDVMGVLFVLRAADPVGRERLRGRPGLWRMAEALDTTRRTSSRQPWEVLLGG